MKKVLVIGVFFCVASLRGMGELKQTPSQKRIYIDELIQHSFSGYGLTDNQLAEIKTYLESLPDDAYMHIVGSVAPRGKSAAEEEQNAAAIIKALTTIATHLDQQNTLMQRQLKETEQMNAAHADDDDDEREFEQEERRETRLFEQYKWKVSTALGVLGSLVASAIAVWQADVATQCAMNTTA